MRILINIDVPALESAIEFYRNGLGLTLERIIDTDVAEMSGAAAIIYLMVKHKNSLATKSATDTRHYKRHWTPVHIDFVVDNIAQARDRALAAGAKQECKCVEWLGSKCITFSDPFGHGFCLLEFEKGTYREDKATL